MKQTAVEWLVSQLNKQGFAKVVTDEEIKQAKEMEKQQIINSHSKGYKETLNYISTKNELNFPDAEQYYKETFKSE